MPFESQAQRALAHAVASGKARGKPGMTKAAAKRMIEDDPGGKLPQHAKKKDNPGHDVGQGLKAAMKRTQRRNNMQGS